VRTDLIEDPNFGVNMCSYVATVGDDIHTSTGLLRCYIKVPFCSGKKTTKNNCCPYEGRWDDAVMECGDYIGAETAERIAVQKFERILKEVVE